MWIKNTSSLQFHISKVGAHDVLNGKYPPRKTRSLILLLAA
jgi:hypothetical protein